MQTSDNSALIYQLYLITFHSLESVRVKPIVQEITSVSCFPKAFKQTTNESLFHYKTETPHHTPPSVEKEPQQQLLNSCAELTGTPVSAEFICSVIGNKTVQSKTEVAAAIRTTLTCVVLRC